jgi:hypothetical protein
MIAEGGGSQVSSAATVMGSDYLMLTFSAVESAANSERVDILPSLLSIIWCLTVFLLLQR